MKVLGSSRNKWSYCFENFNIWWILFIKYSIYNIILRIEMSIVNSKIIFVKKQKQTLAVFTLETDYSCEMGYLFDNSRQIGNMEWF